MNVNHTAHLTTLLALVAALTEGCASQSNSGSTICPLPLEVHPDLVYPRSGAVLSPANAGIIVYGNAPGGVPITIVGARTNVDTLPTAVPSPVPTPTATPPPGLKSWHGLGAAEIRPLLPPGKYDVDATVTSFSCPPGPTSHRVQVKLGSFTLTTQRRQRSLYERRHSPVMLSAT